MNNKLIFENELSEIQKELVYKAFTNINSIIDMQKIQDWMKDNKIYSIILFGSRTRLHENSSSDLDILITDCDALDTVTDNNYMYKQKEIVDSLYESFKENILKNKNIELDFKLNINRFTTDSYNGLTANEPIHDDNDFYFEYQDIPSYFEVYKDKIIFQIENKSEIEDIFDKNSFRELNFNY